MFGCKVVVMFMQRVWRPAIGFHRRGSSSRADLKVFLRVRLCRGRVKVKLKVAGRWRRLEGRAEAKAKAAVRFFTRLVPFVVNRC